MSQRTEFQVGLTVLTALAILIGGVAWLKDYTVTRDTRVWRIAFPQAGGLARSDEVQVNGLRRGEVKSMRLEGDHVIVELKLSREIVLTRDSRVAIRNVGLMGEKVIAVDLKTTGAPYTEDEVIPGTYELGLGEVMGQLGSTVDAIAEMSRQLNTMAGLLTADGRLSNTIRNFSRTSEELSLAVSENRAALREAVENFSAASKTARALTTERESRIRDAIDHFASAAERLDVLTVRLDSLRMVIQNVSTRVESGQGTLGKLVNEDKLYADLNDSVRSLKALIEDIKAHPKKYLKVSIF